MMNLLTVEAQKTPVVMGYLPSHLRVQAAQAKTRTETTEIPSRGYAGAGGFKRLNWFGLKRVPC